MKYELLPNESIVCCTQSRKNRHPLRKQSPIEKPKKGVRRPSAAAPFFWRPPLLYWTFVFSKDVYPLEIECQSDALLWKVFIFDLASYT